LVDFLDEAPSADAARRQARCWDEDAAADEIFAAVSLSKDESEGIFAKMPTLLAKADLDGKVCLDLGCGYGRTLLYAALQGRPAQSIGIDISREMLSCARAHAREHDLRPALARGSIDSLPLRSGSVDFAYSCAVFIHLPKTTVRAALREVVRVLRPGGVALFENSFNGYLNPDGMQTKLITEVGSPWLRTAWVRTYRFREVELLLRRLGPLRSVEIGPERYTVLPTSLLKLPLTPLKPAIKRVNERASRRLKQKSLFVTSWYVRLVK
jgi:ubiquinone/menaquinone biosynthesis C-methylase UbiE